jgi:hypothetical protein
MFRGITARWSHVKDIGKVWWLVVLGLWGTFWTLDAVIAKWGSIQCRELWDRCTLHFPLDWRFGLIGALIILVLLLIEGSFRHHAQTCAKHQQSAKERDWKKEWADLEKRFAEYTRSGVRAHWFHHSLNEKKYWDLQGATSLYSDPVKSLCEIGGKLLLASPRIQLSDETKAESSNEWRWLYFLKALYPHAGRYETAQEGSEDKWFSIMMWSADNLAQLSAQACLKCAALET